MHGTGQGNTLGRDSGDDDWQIRRMKLRKTSYFINIDSQAAESGRLAGKRMAVLTDFHNRDHEAVLDILRNDIPDAIMIPGDLVLGYFPEGE